MKGWLIAGALLALGGSLLLWHGLTTRFGPVGDPFGRLNPSLPQTGATAAMLSDLPTRDSLSNEQISRFEKLSKDPSRRTVSLSKSESAAADATTSLVNASGLAPDTGKIKKKQDYRFDDPYKNRLVEKLLGNGWSEEDLDLLTRFLRHPKAEFRPNVLQINSSHVETEFQYAQHLTSEAIQLCLNFWSLEGEKIRQLPDGGRVPKEVVVAILKVETNFGRYPGKESVFNVYWSLSLGGDPQIIHEVLTTDDPDYAEKRKKMAKRAGWAQRQLKDLLYMARDGHGKNPLEIMGSWAGAFGLAQFIPASYRAYGRDGNQDGVIDLDNVSDAAASISNYLTENGWPRDNSLKARRKAVKAYNHSEHYVNCVLALADSLTGQLN